MHSIRTDYDDDGAMWAVSVLRTQAHWFAVIWTNSGYFLMHIRYQDYQPFSRRCAHRGMSPTLPLKNERTNFIQVLRYIHIAIIISLDLFPSIIILHVFSWTV